MDWKSKINSVILIFLILLSLASALTIGGIITQEQLNATDIQAIDLEPQIESKEKTKNQIRVWFSYFSLEETGNDYKVVRNTNVAVYNLNNYNSCRESGNSKTNCITIAKAELISQAKRLISGEKTYLEELQSQDYSSEITVNDFDITNNDLE